MKDKVATCLNCKYYEEIGEKETLMREAFAEQELEDCFKCKKTQEYSLDDYLSCELWERKY